MSYSPHSLGLPFKIWFNFFPDLNKRVLSQYCFISLFNRCLPVKRGYSSRPCPPHKATFIFFQKYTSLKIVTALGRRHDTIPLMAEATFSPITLTKRVAYFKETEQFYISIYSILIYSTGIIRKLVRKVNLDILTNEFRRSNNGHKY